MNDLLLPVSGLAIATLGGAAIGLEREWSGKAAGAHPHFGGIRTFTLLGGLGGIAGGFAAAGWMPIATAVISGALALVAIGYAGRVRQDIDATTEVAAVVVLAAGAAAGGGQLALASAIVSVTAVVLLEKGRLHALVGRVDDIALRASARFAVLALVVLPLLPAGEYGPFGAVKPRTLWAFVLFFSGLSFLAWLARRFVGPAIGIVAAGALGGVISSTSVTLTFARTSRRGQDAAALAIGTVSACTVMLVRVAIAAAILNWSIAQAFIPYAVAGLVAGALAIAALAWEWRGPESTSDHAGEEGSPLQLRAALQMAVFFQIVMIVVAAVTAWWSLRAILITSAMIGLTDLDALTLSLSRQATTLAPGLAARALSVGALSNTLLKLAVTLSIGAPQYRWRAGTALAVIAIAIGGALWW